MKYQQIIETIKAGDWVEIKGSLGLPNGVYVVDEVDEDDDDQTLLVNDFWAFNEYVVRKLSPREEALSITESQDSQNENDDSQSGNEIVGANIAGVPLTPCVVYVPSRHACPRNKYDREIVKGVFVDVYDVLDAFDVKDPCLQHLIKKALALGIRGHKDALEDYQDIVDSANRGLEKYKEKHL